MSDHQTTDTPNRTLNRVLEKMAGWPVIGSLAHAALDRRDVLSNDALAPDIQSEPDRDALNYAPSHAYSDPGPLGENEQDAINDLSISGQLHAGHTPGEVLQSVSDQVREQASLPPSQGPIARAGEQAAELRSVRMEANEILSRTVVAYERAGGASERSELRSQVAELNSLVSAIDWAIEGADIVTVGPMAGGNMTDIQMQQHGDFIASIQPLIERIEAAGIEIEAEIPGISRDDHARDHDELER